MELLDNMVQTEQRALEVIELEAALEKLEAESIEKASLVKLRYFAALSHVEAAEILGISLATADRHWAYARAFLHQEVSNQE